MSEISPQILKRLSKELLEITNSPPEGISVVINEENITDIQAYIQGPGTPYHKGTFKIKLQIPPNFPQSPPLGFFVTKIFHPNVANNGEICVSTLKKDWKADVTMTQLLLTIKCLLIVPNAESALNEEAGKLLLEDYDEYAKRARLMTGIHAKQRETESNRILTPSDRNVSPQKRPIEIATNLPKKIKNEKKSVRRL